MNTIITRIEIDAGHRLLKHEGKCKNVHGHRYVFEIEVQAPALDDVGRVLDFGEVKRILGGWLDKNWDHGFVAQVGDPIIPFLLEHQQKLYVMDQAPTAENMVAHFYNIAAGLLTYPLQVSRVRLYETPNGSAVCP